MKNKDLVIKAVEYLRTLESGTEISTCRVLHNVFGLREEDGKYRVGENSISFGDMFELDDAIRKAAKESGLMIDTSKYKNAVMGLPFHIPYAVKKKN